MGNGEDRHGGTREWEMGNGEWETGIGKRLKGVKECNAHSKKRKAGLGDWGMGNTEGGMGDRDWEEAKRS